MRTMAIGALVGAGLLAACGGQNLDVGSNREGGADSSFPVKDSGPAHRDGSSDGKAPSPDARTDGSKADGGGSYEMGGTPVDAGYYYGDGSFWVEGGAYPDVGTPEAGPDTGAVDGSAGCGALSACCPTLSVSSQPLCESTASAGNAANCTTELEMLESEGSCTGVTVVASDIEETPFRLVSDGTLLFWITDEASPGLLAVPVQGGPITVLLSGETAYDQGAPFLAVDDVNLYVLEGASVVRIPKDGSPATLMNEVGATVISATSLGATTYWLEDAPHGSFAVKSSPSMGNTITTIATFSAKVPALDLIGVTSATVFVGMEASQVYDFPMSGVPASGPAAIAGYACVSLTSDTDAVYCSQAFAGSNVRIASDGSVTALGPTSGSSSIAFDDTYAYWVDRTTVGVIKKAPKAGGGSVTVLAQDTSPNAIAVDSARVYWADDEGYIKSIPK
jgi:hypothetical protein